MRPAGEALTPYEARVLRLVADGLSNPEIAWELRVTVDTVAQQVSRLLLKLGAVSRANAVWLGVAAGVLVPDVPVPVGPVAVQEPAVPVPLVVLLLAVAESAVAGKPYPAVQREARVALAAARRRVGAGVSS